MAIDTETKRKSAIGVGKYGWRLLPKPDGTIGAEDRRHAVGHYSRTSAVGIVYTPVGVFYLHQATQWTRPPGIYFEVSMLAVSGSVNARLRNTTDDAVVASSTVDTASATLVRVRSPVLALTDSTEYRAEAGTIAGDSGTIQGAQIVALL